MAPLSLPLPPAPALRRKTMYLILCLSYMMVFIHGVVMTIFAKDLMADMSLSPVAMGMLGSAYLYAYAPVMLVSGIIAAWLGPRKTLALLFAISGVGGIVFATSHSLAAAMIGRALCGVGLSATMTSSFTLFGRWYSGKRLPTITALFFATGGLGTVAGISAMPFFKNALGWRGTFAGLAGLTLVYALAQWLVIRDWPPDGEKLNPDSVRVKRSDGIGAADLFYNLCRAAKTADFWKLVFLFVALSGAYFGFNGLWATPYLKDVYGLSDAEAGLMVGMGGWGFIVGIPFATWLGDKVLYSNRAVIAGGGVLGLLCVAALVWKIDGLGRVGIYVFMITFGIAINAPTANAYAAMRSLYGAKMAGGVGGAVGCTGFLGGAATQIVCGRLLQYAHDHGWQTAPGYALVFSVLFLNCAVCIAVGLALSPGADPVRPGTAGPARQSFFRLPGRRKG